MHSVRHLRRALDSCDMRLPLSRRLDAAKRRTAPGDRRLANSAGHRGSPPAKCLIRTCGVRFSPSVLRMGCLAFGLAVIGGLLLLGVPGVGTVLAVVWVAACLLGSRALRPAPASDKPPQHEVLADTRAVRVGGPRGGTTEHIPPRPTGEPREPWSPDTREFEVAGEWYRRDHLRELFSRAGALSPEGAELHHQAALVPDPTNPYDRRAVAVYVEGLHVGYLERSDAARYHEAIANSWANGVQVTVRSRQWVRASGHELWARVTLWLPEPSEFAPANPIPADALLLPRGASVQVTKEEAHQDVLAPLLTRATRVPVAVTLHEITEQRPRSTAQVVEVRIDGKRVGVLTATQTSNLLPLVRLAERGSLIATACAVVRGNSLKAEVTLYVARAQDVPHDWLAAQDA